MRNKQQKEIFRLWEYLRDSPEDYWLLDALEAYYEGRERPPVDKPRS